MHNYEYTDLAAGYTNAMDHLGDGRENALESMDIFGLANFLDQKPRKVVILTGAGVSVNAGIPDYRSKGGFYDTLDVHQFDISNELKEQIQDSPEFVYHKNFFKQAPEVTWTCISPMYTTPYEPTETHYFMSLLAKKSKTCQLLTQNVDGLHRRAGFPNDLCCEVHGTRIDFRCDRKKCKRDIDFDLEKCVSFCKERGPYDVPKCSCGGSIRPDVVMFGEDLPDEWRRLCTHPTIFPNAEVLIIAGTSLAVSPVNTIVRRVGENCVRVLINMEKVGWDLGMFSRTQRHRDVFIKGDCDETFRDLARLLGWQNELDELIEAGERFVDSLHDFSTMIPAPDVLDVIPEDKISSSNQILCKSMKIFQEIGCSDVAGKYTRWQENIYLKEGFSEIRINIGYDMSEHFGDDFENACVIYKPGLEDIILYAAEKYGMPFLSIAGLDPPPKAFA